MNITCSLSNVKQQNNIGKSKQRKGTSLMDNVQIGHLIRKLRRRNKLTMVDFAKKIGLSQPSLSRIESGEQEINFSLLGKICKVLNISMVDFISLAEGQSKLQYIEYDSEDLNTEEELNTILLKILSQLSFEQKKGLYTLLFPYIKE